MPLSWPVSSARSLRSVLSAALGAGVAAGLVTGTLQQIFLVPMILQAERFEGEAALNSADVWEPSGVERNLYGIVFNCLGAVGFALVLAACYAARGSVNWQRGLLWGLGGYASVALAPALGLPPELPGAHAGDLGLRQLWWLFTAFATASGLASMLLLRGRWPKLAGLALLLLPHLIGAPQPTSVDEGVSASLARWFAFGSLTISLVLWLMLGALTAALMNRWTDRNTQDR